MVNRREEGVTKLLFDDSPKAHGHGRIPGSIMRPTRWPADSHWRLP